MNMAAMTGNGFVWPTAWSRVLAVEETDGTALAESFFSRLNKERIRKRIYKTRGTARADVFDNIEAFYNRAFRHSHLDGISPEAFESASL